MTTSVYLKGSPGYAGAEVGSVIGSIAFCLFCGGFVVNGLVMLVSPDRWFRLPSYVSFRGSLTERKYMATLFGRLQIRLLGLIFLSFGAGMMGGFFGISANLPPRVTSLLDRALNLYSGRWACVVVSLSAIACGAAMLLKPKWWIAKYFIPQAKEDKGLASGVDRYQETLVWIARGLSLPLIAIGIYFLLQCSAVR